MPQGPSKLVRIGVYYDGSFLFHVSNYYLHHHERRARLSIAGVQDFIAARVAELEQTDVRLCRIVEAQHFRGRLRSAEADEREALYRDRVFDDVLIRAGVTPRCLHQAREGEKGVEVLLALEAFEAAAAGHVDVVALFAGDGDFLPLVRKLHARGVRVLLLAWDFRYQDQHGTDREIRTAHSLIEEASDPVMMSAYLDDRAKSASTQGLFVPRRDAASALEASVPVANGTRPARPAPPPATLPLPTGPLSAGAIDAIRNGYGFIHPDDGGPNLFFLYQEVVGTPFAELREGDPVEFIAGMNERGPCARAVRKILDAPRGEGFGDGLDGEEEFDPDHEHEHDALAEVPRHDDDEEEEAHGNR